MVATAPQTASKPRLSRAEQREQTRARILQAALDIIVEDGIRAVRHRAVADRAGVALGSTTYHFTSIEDLIGSAFEYWRDKALLKDNPFYLRSEKLLAPYRGEPVPEHERRKLGAKIHRLLVAYVCDQLQGKQDDRLLELAFYHEAVRYPSLRKKVMDGWQSQYDYLLTAHRAMGSPQPAADARITAALLRDLERVAVIADEPSLDTAIIESSLRRHLEQVFGVTMPGTAGN